MKKKLFLLMLCLLVFCGCGKEKDIEKQETEKGFTNNTDQKPLDIPKIALDNFNKLLETYGNHPTVVSLLATREGNGADYMYLVYDKAINSKGEEYKDWEVLTLSQNKDGSVKFLDSIIIYLEEYESNEINNDYKETKGLWKTYTKSGSGLLNNQQQSFYSALSTDKENDYEPIIILSTNETKNYIEYYVLAYQTNKETNLTNYTIVKYKEDGRGNSTLETNGYFSLEIF